MIRAVDTGRYKYREGWGNTRGKSIARLTHLHPSHFVVTTMSIKMEAVDFGVERISFSSAKPVDDVLKIVREQLSSDLAGPALFARLKAATSAQEIEEIVLSVTANGEHDFVYVHPEPVN